MCGLTNWRSQACPCTPTDDLAQMQVKLLPQFHHPYLLKGRAEAADSGVRAAGVQLGVPLGVDAEAIEGVGVGRVVSKQAPLGHSHQERLIRTGYDHSHDAWQQRKKIRGMCGGQRKLSGSHHERRPEKGTRLHELGTHGGGEARARRVGVQGDPEAVAPVCARGRIVRVVVQGVGDPEL